MDQARMNNVIFSTIDVTKRTIIHMIVLELLNTGPHPLDEHRGHMVVGACYQMVQMLDPTQSSPTDRDDLLRACGLADANGSPYTQLAWLKLLDMVTDDPDNLRGIIGIVLRSRQLENLISQTQNVTMADYTRSLRDPTTRFASTWFLETGRHLTTLRTDIDRRFGLASLNMLLLKLHHMADGLADLAQD